MKPKPKPRGVRPQKVSDDQIREALKNSLGNISTVCKRLNITRQTFYDYKAKKPWLEKLMHDEVERTYDWVESKILEKVEQGDTVMTIFFAKTKMKQRGYVERQELMANVSQVPTLVDDVPTNCELPPQGTEPPRG